MNDRLSAYLDDELSPAARAAVERELLASAPLAAELAEVAAARAAVRSLPVREAPPDLWSDGTPAPSDAPDELTTRRRARRVRIGAVAAALAAVVVVGAAFVVPERDGVEPQIATVTQRHTVQSPSAGDPITQLSGLMTPEAQGR